MNTPQRIRNLTKSLFTRKTRERRRRLGRLTPRVEQLENRLVLSSIFVSGSNIFFTAGASETNDLTVSESAGTLTFADPGSTITPGAGAWTIDSPNQVSISTAGISQLTLSLGDLDDSLDASGVGAGSGLSLTSMNGGVGNDSITGSQLRDIITISGGTPGIDTVDGQGSGDDLLNIGVDADMTLTDTSLTIGGGPAGTYANMEQVNFFGGASDNVLDASGVTAASGFGVVSINGQAGDDTITGSQIRDIITVSGSAPGVDTIDGQGSGDDLLNIGVDADMTLTDTSLTIGGGPAGTYANMEQVNFFGGASDNVLDASAVTAASGFGVVSINGQAGNDTITGSQIRD
ncbi:MAG: hypothetical protein QGG36_07030, partial [Pirellulaceae bacterium]|nr:hypothetical protein [Pirellulaceae bacterium]